MKKYSLWSNFIYEYGILWRKKKDAFFASLAESILAILLPLSASYLTAYVVQLCVDKTPVGRIFATVMGAFALYGLAEALAAYLRERCASQYIEVRLSNYLMGMNRKIVELRLDRLEEENMRLKIEKAMMAIGANVWGIEGFYHNTFAFAIKLLGLVTYITILGALHPGMLILLIVTAIISNIASYLVNRYGEKHRDDEARENMTMRYVNHLTDNGLGGKDIRIYGLTGWIIDKYSAAIKNIRKLNFKAEMLGFGRDSIDNIFALLRNIVCYGYLITRLRDGMPVSEFVFLIGLIGGFSGWLSNIARYLTNIIRDSHMISDYRAMLDMDDEEDEDNKISLGDEEEITIEFQHVSYRYPGAKEEVIKDVSFILRPGEKLALVGVNGAGKSTIVKLISGLYLPTGGKVLVNGVDTALLKLSSFYSKEAVVFQETFMIGYSIAENIAFSQEYDENRIIEVLKKAGLYEKVSSLHKGINTCIGTDIEEDGVQLSGGEVQKLLLARALYKNPKLMILDEPTAALDAIAESGVYDSYREHLKGISSIYISHRLASTKFCDRILFLDEGCIKEVGTHEELMSRDSRYREMFEVQSKYYKEENDGTECC